MSPQITALIKPEFVVEPENEAALFARRTHTMDRASGLVCRHQMLVTILDPLHRSSDAHRRRAGQHIFRIQLAADSETAAHMPFMEMNALERHPKHCRKRLAVVMRHLRCA